MLQKLFVNIAILLIALCCYSLLYLLFKLIDENNNHQSHWTVLENYSVTEILEYITANTKTEVSELIFSIVCISNENCPNLKL